MKDIYWMKSNGEEEFIETVADNDQVFKAIYEFVANFGCKVYYVRYWYEEETNRTVYDFGSWSDFIVVYERETNEG